MAMATLCEEDEAFAEANGSDRDSVDFQLPIQAHSRPPTPSHEAFDAQVLVLRKGQREQDLDRQYMLAALEMGVSVPYTPRLAPDPATVQLDDATEFSSPEDSLASTLTSRVSDSTQPTSCDSSDRGICLLYQRKAFPSPGASSLPTGPPSLKPSTVGIMSSSRILNGLRRLSSLGRRKRPAASAPPTTTISHSTFIDGPAMGRHRPATIRSSTTSLPLPLSFKPRRAVGTLLPSRSESHIPTISTFTKARVPRDARTLASPRPMTPPLGGENETDGRRAARQRSERSRDLQRLRAGQLDEQARFLRFQQEQLSSARSRHAEGRRKIERAYRERRSSLRDRHAKTNGEMENRQLTAEVDLETSLRGERHACETKLKHMDAYCNGRTVVPGMPPRRVTEADFRALYQQYQVRGGMDSLHRSRINVLREKQAKQLERVSAKQAEEMARLEREMGEELELQEAKGREEEGELEKELVLRKARMLWRWKVGEAVERRRLEMERGVAFGELPEVEWGKQC